MQFRFSVIQLFKFFNSQASLAFATPFLTFFSPQLSSLNFINNLICHFLVFSFQSLLSYLFFTLFPSTLSLILAEILPTHLWVFQIVQIFFRVLIKEFFNHFIIFFIQQMFTLQNTLAKTVQLKNKDITKGVSDCPSFQITKGPQKDKVVSKSNEWTIKEVTKYIVVLERKAEVLEGKPQSQLWEQYKEMAKFIKTRNYRQCKIYHQKLFSQFENVLDITENLLRTQLIQTTQLEKERKAYEIFLENENKEVEIQQNMEKQKNLPRTRTDYDEEDMIPKAPQQLQLPSISCFPPQFPSMQHYQTTPFGVYGYQPMMEKSKKPTAEDWIECHNLFLQYASKLNEMKMKEWSM